MNERNEHRYQLEQKNQLYILTTVLVDDKLKLICQVSDDIFEGIFNIIDLLNLSKYFQPTHTIEQIQMYLNGIIEKQRVGITRNGGALSLILYLINKDQICIPLIKKSDNIYNFNNYSNISSTNQYITTQNNNLVSYFTNPSVQQQVYSYNNNSNQQYLNIVHNQNPNNFYVSKPVTGISGSPSVPIQKKTSGNIQTKNFGNPKQYSKVDSSNNNYNYQYDENKIGKLEENTNIIKAEQEKLKNDMKKLLEEASKLKEQNQVFKTDHESLTKENATLKNTNDYYKEQLTEYEKKFKEMVSQIEELKNNNTEYQKLKEENDSLKNQVTLLNKDVDAFESQNNEIRKMYEDLEKENLYYKGQYDEMNKENELLRGQIDELNNNFTTINNELENIKDENNLFKKNLEEQQKNNINEEEINRLIEENNLYKQKAEENELLKKQIEDLQYQIQMGQERQDRVQEDDDEEKEVKGDIIHDIKELEMLTKKINKDNNKKIIINLLYKASVDGDKAAIFHEKCDDAQNTIVLVETKNGKRFGGFTTCSWSGNCVDKNDSEAFIFSFDKMKTYDNIPGDEAIGCYPKFGPIFLGCQIKIFDNAFVKGGTTFEKGLNFNTEEDYELTGGERVFGVKDIEVYEVIIE